MNCGQKKTRKFQYLNRNNRHTCGAYSFEIRIIYVCVCVCLCILYMCVCVCVYIYIYIYIYIYANVVNRQAVQHFNINSEAQQIIETPHDNEISKWGHSTVLGVITFSIYLRKRWLLPVENHNENSITTLTQERAYIWKRLDDSAFHQVLWVSYGWKNKNVQIVRRFAPSVRHWESVIAKLMYMSQPCEGRCLSDTECLS